MVSDTVISDMVSDTVISDISTVGARKGRVTARLVDPRVLCLRCSLRTLAPQSSRKLLSGSGLVCSSFSDLTP
jgi:hypothetical protein